MTRHLITSQKVGDQDMSHGSFAFEFKKDVDPAATLLHFWPPEDGFVWSTSVWCQLSFDIPSECHEMIEAPFDIAWDIDVFRAPPDLEGQNIYIYFNGLRVATRFLTKRLTVFSALPAYTLRESDNIITIDTPNVARPTEHGEGDDRLLGIKLFSVQFRGM